MYPYFRTSLEYPLTSNDVDRFLEFVKSVGFVSKKSFAKISFSLSNKTVDSYNEIIQVFKQHKAPLDFIEVTYEGNLTIDLSLEHLLNKLEIKICPKAIY